MSDASHQGSNNQKNDRDRAMEIYNAWRHSLQFGKHSYNDVAASIDEAVAKVRAEIKDMTIRVLIIDQFNKARARISEFTDDAEAIPEDVHQGVELVAKCCTCGRPIAEYEQRFDSSPPGAVKCVDCHIK
jgi:hypothetical protein